MKILNIIFPLTCIILTILFIVQKMFMEKLKRTEYAAIMALFVGLYIIEAVFAIIFLNNYIFKVVMLFFALSPFLIGKFATYKTENIYSYVQTFCIVLSGIFIYLI